jgi:transposase
MSIVAGRYPKEFKEDVVRVARDRGPGETLEQIAQDFGVQPVTLSNWLRQADIEDGIKPGVTADQAVELPEAKRRIRGWSRRTRSFVALRRTCPWRIRLP